LQNATIAAYLEHRLRWTQLSKDLPGLLRNQAALLVLVPVAAAASVLRAPGAGQ